MYIELHARSAFSCLEGASLPEELAAVCAQLNLPAMALLDVDGVYGAPRFHMAAQKTKIKAHIGAGSHLRRSLCRPNPRKSATGEADSSLRSE